MNTVEKLRALAQQYGEVTIEFNAAIVAQYMIAVPRDADDTDDDAADDRQCIGVSSGLEDAIDEAYRLTPDFWQ